MGFALKTKDSWGDVYVYPHGHRLEHNNERGSTHSLNLYLAKAGA